MQVNTHSVPIDLPARRPQVAPLAESESFAVLAFYKEYCKCEEPLASEADPSTIVEVGMPPRVLDPSLARAAKKSGDGVMHVRVRCRVVLVELHKYARFCPLACSSGPCKVAVSQNQLHL